MIVICNGMLRSGSTLQYNLAAMVMEARGSVSRAGFMGGFSDPKVRAKLEDLKAAENWSIVKTHEPPLPRTFYDERVRVLFSYRDVRDIAASMRKKWDYSFQRILSQVDAMIEIEEALSDIPGVLVQPYDLLYRDVPKAARQVATYLNTSVTDDDVSRIAEALSLPNQRNGPRLMRLLRPLLQGRRYDKRTLFHDNHISPSGGREKDWVNQFTQDEIAMLKVRYSSWLIDHGFVDR